MMVVVVVFVEHLLDDTIWNYLNRIICMANSPRILLLAFGVSSIQCPQKLSILNSILIACFAIFLG